jgi:hypothetical protein
VEDTTKYAVTDKMLAANYRSDQRVEVKRKTRETLEKEAKERKEREELEVSDDLDIATQVDHSDCYVLSENANDLQREKQRRLKLMLEEQEQQIQKELERRKHLELRDEKVRQRIREESDELKQLESKLKTAYLNKERAAQIEETKLIEERKKVFDHKVSVTVCSTDVASLSVAQSVFDNFFLFKFFKY